MSDVVTISHLSKLTEKTTKKRLDLPERRGDRTSCYARPQACCVRGRRQWRCRSSPCRRDRTRLARSSTLSRSAKTWDVSRRPSWWDDAYVRQRSFFRSMLELSTIFRRTFCRGNILRSKCLLVDGNFRRTDDFRLSGRNSKRNLESKLTICYFDNKKNRSGLFCIFGHHGF